MSSDFCDYVIDLLSSWAKVSAKAMFGGYGMYRQGQIFAIVVDDTLYFKVGDVAYDITGPRITGGLLTEQQIIELALLVAGSAR